jgi:DNA-binding beta-propeller fold protein YncE
MLGELFKRLGILGFIAVLVINVSPGLAVAKEKPEDRQHSFRRIATFPVCFNTDVNQETVAEIVTSTKDGRLLVYTDSVREVIGFIDISNPSKPKPGGVVEVGGEPTSAAVLDRYLRKFALAVVNTSKDFVDTSGKLVVIDIKTRNIVRSIELGGQPDSIAVSPDGTFAAIAIENERDEDLEDGSPPQSPSGFVVIVDLDGPPAFWKTRTVDLVGIPDLFPDDPEPEFVDINDKNIAAVTLQENNHIVLIDLKKGEVIEDWPAGSVDLQKIDTEENGLIELNGLKADIVREPDGVAWTGCNVLATADEGDLDGGSRGFTLFNTEGKVLFNSGNSVEHLVTRVGHYPEGRSENKGNEPEGIEFGKYGKDGMLFVCSERSSVVLVYKLDNRRFKPEFFQLLPGGVEPEGLLAIPQRNLLVTASEADARGDGVRSVITIYRLEGGKPTYPTVFSSNRDDGLPIPWGALSALAADPDDRDIAYTAYDSFYKESRIFRLDVSRHPAIITDEIVLKADGVTVNLDIEGLAVSKDGGFWVVSEGDGSVNFLNLLIKVAADGVIEETIELPDSVNVLQTRFGFEGVAEDSDFVYVAFQREWVDDPKGLVRIGRYDTNVKDWVFYYYPLDQPTSPNGGWVGLSEIVALGKGDFAVIERDNQAGTDARIKKIYRVSVNGITPVSQGEVFPVLEKKFVRNLISDLTADNGPVLEKVEGLTVLPNGDTLIVTDNDGVDGSSGETQLINLGKIFRKSWRQWDADGDDD